MDEYTVRTGKLGRPRAVAMEGEEALECWAKIDRFREVYGLTMNAMAHKLGLPGKGSYAAWRGSKKKMPLRVWHRFLLVKEQAEGQRAVEAGFYVRPSHKVLLETLGKGNRSLGLSVVCDFYLQYMRDGDEASD